MNTAETQALSSEASTLLRRSLLLIAALLFINTLYAFVLDPDSLALWNFFVVFVPLFAAYVPMHRGNTNQGLTVLGWGLWLLVTYLSLAVAGIFTPGIFAYPFVIMLTGWMQGRRQAYLMCAATVLVFLLLIFGVEFGWLAAGIRRTPRQYLIPYSLIAILSALLSVALHEQNKRHLATELGLTKALELKNRALEQDQRDLKMLMEGVPAYIASFGTDSCIRVCNSAYAAVFGFQPDEMVGKHVSSYVTPAALEQLMPHWHRCMAGESRSYRAILRDPQTGGLVRATDITLTPEFDQQGVVVGLFSMLINVTAQVTQEVAIRQLNTSLEERVEQRTNELQTSLETLKQTQADLIQSEKLASLGSMVAGVAHELNTPVGNAMMMFSTLSAHQRDFERTLETGITRSALRGFLDTVREVVDVVERNLRRTAELVESFKQVAVDQSSEQRRGFALDEVVNEVSVSLVPTLRRSGIAFENTTPLGIRMDSFPGPLGQVLINLINNALKHAFEGRDKGHMRLVVGRQDEGWVRLVFSDDGVGIAPDHIAKVFDPFFTTKMGQGGTGLGLNIVRNIVTGLLGGRIEVRSTVGVGTEFILELPRVAP